MKTNNTNTASNNTGKKNTASKNIDYKKLCSQLRHEIKELKEENEWVYGRLTEKQDTILELQQSNRQLQLTVQMYADNAGGYRMMVEKSSEHFDRALGIMRDLSVKQA